MGQLTQRATDIEVILLLGGHVHERTSAIGPENALYAAQTMWDECIDSHPGTVGWEKGKTRMEIAFYVGGKRVVGFTRRPEADLTFRA